MFTRGLFGLFPHGRKPTRMTTTRSPRTGTYPDNDSRITPNDGAGGLSPAAMGTVFAVAAVLLIIFTFTDRAISDAVVDHGSVFGTFFQTYGEFPPYVLAAAALQVLAVCVWRSGLAAWLKALGVVFLTWAGYLSILEWTENEESYRRSWAANRAAGTPIGVANNDESGDATWAQFAPSVFTALILLIIVAALTWYLLGRLSDETVRALGVAAVVTLAVIWAGGEINSQMKNLWGRFRPYEVDAGEGPFTTWLHVNLPNGHRSFPSGHTQEGTTLAALAILLRPLGGKPWKVVLWVGIAWGALMGLSRVVVGAHWATDVTASFMLTLGIILVGVWLVPRLLTRFGAGEGAAAPESESPVQGDARAV